MIRAMLILAGVLLMTPTFAQGNFVWTVDDFSSVDLSAWQSSMSPEYYRGGEGQKGLEIIDDPERGQVLRCDVRYVDDKASEPCFITRKLTPQPGKLDVVGVRFYAKFTEAAIAPEGGFRVRLRTSDTAFTDYDVQEQLGRPFPVGEWVAVNLETGIGPNVRNIWNDVFGTIREITFRLDDIDDRNAQFALLLDDVQLVMRQPAQEQSYEPKQSERPAHEGVRVLLLKHRAAGYYGLEEAIRQAYPEAQIDTCHYRGLHFEFFDFPQTREDVLAYDLIVLLSIDPFVMTWEQATWIADAVVSGSRLVVFGGPVTLNASRDFKAPLRAVLPVTFEPGAKALPINKPPVPGEPHYLNAGLDPAGLGTVTEMQDLRPIEGAAVPWTAGDRPLVITAPMGKGVSTVVNTWVHAANSATGDFFTSTLSDDFLRTLVRFGPESTTPAITDLKLPPLSVMGAAELTAVATVSGERREFPISIPAPKQAEEKYPFVIAASAPDGGREVRDFEITVLHPLDLRVLWTRGKYTFAPGSPVEFTVDTRRRDLARVSPGSGPRVDYSGGQFPVSVDNFVDPWVYQPGTETVMHNLAGAEDVRVQERTENLLPRWNVTGFAVCARPAENLRIGEDGRILRVERDIQANPGGKVRVQTRYEVLQDMRVSRLPLNVSFPVSNYAGLKYTATQEEGVREGVFPVDTTPGNLFSGHGLDMTIQTPDGPVALRVVEPGVRVWLRDLRQFDMTTYRLEIESPLEGKEARAGDTYTLTLEMSGPVTGATDLLAALQEMPHIQAELVDPTTGYRWDVPRVESETGARFAGSLPNLASGEYALEVTASVAGETVCTQRATCYVVDPLDLGDFFPLMSIVGVDGDGFWLDDAGIQARVEDLIDHGFNTAAITGTSSFQSDTPRNNQRLKGVAESYAQRRGMATTYEYSSFTDLNASGPPAVCPFDPGYRDHLRGRLEWQVDVGKRTPRLISAKILDEPTVNPGVLANISEQGKAEFQRRYGIEYSADYAKSQEPYERWAFADFMGEYLGEGYRHSRGILDEMDAGFDLLLTYMAAATGYQRPLNSQQDGLDWTRHVSWADFDVYPYFYPKSQRIRMVQAGFSMSFMRDISRARKVPWGFYVELDDRNWPFQKNPRQASAECAFTAIARGADYLNSFINTVATTGTQSRPERWEDAGKAFRMIRRMGPMLKHMPAVRARLALLFPNSQQAIGNGYATPDYALAAIQGGFGECDIHNEQVIVETGEIPYPALVLLKAEFIHEKLAELLEQWVRAGGVLICDRLPTQSHRGAPPAWSLPAQGDPQPACGPIQWSMASLGEGKIVFLQTDINEEFRKLVEVRTPEPAACKAFRAGLAQLLDGIGLVPNVRVEYSETQDSVDLVEAGLRGGEHAALLLVVNHQPSEQEVTVTLDRADLRWLVDMDSMSPVTAQVQDGKTLLRLTVPARWARAVAGYRTRPAGVQLSMPGGRVQREGTLSYSVTVAGEGQEPVMGGVLMEAEVTGPDGKPVSRFGGSFAPLSGTQTVRVPVPVNAAQGNYGLTIRFPQWGATSSTSFQVE
ncbi:MAG: hypothetical protein HPY44_03570 [Armatimonadetes bacterium]|nr:hypothetical protein [Armatimonadota bacterium]